MLVIFNEYYALKHMILQELYIFYWRWGVNANLSYLKYGKSWS